MAKKIIINMKQEKMFVETSDILIAKPFKGKQQTPTAGANANDTTEVWWIAITYKGDKDQKFIGGFKDEITCENIIINDLS